MKLKAGAGRILYLFFLLSFHLALGQAGYELDHGEQTQKLDRLQLDRKAFW